MTCSRKILFLLLLTLLTLPAAAQRYRGERRVVRGGMFEKPDTLASAAADSLLVAADSLFAASDSLRVAADSLLSAADTELLSDAGRQAAATADSLRVFSALRDSLAADSLAVSAAELFALQDTVDTEKRKRRPLLSDSMGLSGVCWASLVLPGFGQIYNKQYWKLPILYSTVGASLGLFIHEQGRYRPLKREYETLTNQGLERTEQLNSVQSKMIRSNTLREVYLGAAIVSYLYFIGDAAVCYSTNEVSNVKRATTLSMICPGAGQIYNKSYWRVPIVLGGIATTIYCIDWNNRGYDRFKKAYRLRAGYDKNPEDYPNGSTDEFKGRYSASFLKNLRDSYRRNRDLCIILTAGLYILQVIDAHVDAHLRDFDISDDLSMNLMPVVDYAYAPSLGRTSPLFGMNLSINF